MEQSPKGWALWGWSILEHGGPWSRRLLEDGLGYDEGWATLEYRSERWGNLDNGQQDGTSSQVNVTEDGVSWRMERCGGLGGWKIIDDRVLWKMEYPRGGGALWGKGASSWMWYPRGWRIVEDRASWRTEHYGGGGIMVDGGLWGDRP